jgi:hypothetical protein
MRSSAVLGFAVVPHGFVRRSRDPSTTSDHTEHGQVGVATHFQMSSSDTVRKNVSSIATIGRGMVRSHGPGVRFEHKSVPHRIDGHARMTIAPELGLQLVDQRDPLDEHER